LFVIIVRYCVKIVLSDVMLLCKSDAQGETSGQRDDGYMYIHYAQ